MTEGPQAASTPALPPDLAREFAAARENGCVGTRLLSEDARCRVWTIVLPPGSRVGFHTHVLDYFWTAVTAGRARSQYGDGRVAEVDYRAGDIEHLSFGPGESMTHDLANVGDTELLFTTVEFLDSANPPLALPPAVRAEADRGAA
jgi:quercetin dioxygenase-like cupin family protein